MISTSTLDVAHDFPGMSSRSMGNLALARAQEVLTEAEVLELDFGARAPSPSFADQFVGGLAGSLGLEQFKRRVRIHNAPSHVMSLFRHVILTRAAEANHG